jgi:hypothetical protein
MDGWAHCSSSIIDAESKATPMNKKSQATDTPFSPIWRKATLLMAALFHP